MSNPGKHPIDAESPIGKLRLAVGDTSYTALTPPVAGQVDYANFSDAELQELVDLAGENRYRAAAMAWAKLAAIAAASSVSIKTNDLGYSRDRTASELRELAKFWAKLATEQDEGNADESIEIVGITPLDSAGYSRAFGII